MKLSKKAKISFRYMTIAEKKQIEKAARLFHLNDLITLNRAVAIIKEAQKR